MSTPMREQQGHGVWSLPTHMSSTGNMNLGVRWTGHVFRLHHITYWPCDLTQAYFLICEEGRILPSSLSVVRIKCADLHTAQGPVLGT